MRRKEKEITDFQEMASILDAALSCRIGLVDGNLPYVIPMNFGWEGLKDNEGKPQAVIFIHSSPTGRKLPLLSAGKMVCFQTDTALAVQKSDSACSWGMHYKSLIGWGIPEKKNDPSEKVRILNRIMQKYGGSESVYSEKQIENTEIFSIPLDLLTGKNS